MELSGLRFRGVLLASVSGIKWSIPGDKRQDFGDVFISYL